MELFLDTADAQAVKELSETLTIAGVTTNPTIITRSGKTLEQVIDEMCKTLAPNQKSFFQVIATDFDGILEETRRICALRENAPQGHQGREGRGSECSGNRHLQC